MLPVQIELLLVVAVLVHIATGLGDIWCQSGGAKRSYNPAQCEEGTLECYKYTCEAEDGKYTASFISRGCGVSVVTTATGLRNESCFQAMSVCQAVGGIGQCHTCNNKHMCNGVSSLGGFILVILLLVPAMFIYDGLY